MLLVEERTGPTISGRPCKELEDHEIDIDYCIGASRGKLKFQSDIPLQWRWWRLVDGAGDVIYSRVCIFIIPAGSH